MDKYINISDLKSVLCEKCNECQDPKVSCDYQYIFNSLPKIEIVRCRECEHHHWEQEPCHGKIVHYCDLPHMKGIEVFKEFFCYYGKCKG